MSTREFTATRTMLANAMATAGAELLEYMGTAGALAAIPNTEPQQYVVAGTLAMIGKLLPTPAAAGIEGLTRYRDLGGFGVTEASDGQYVKLADVERLLGAHAPVAAKMTQAQRDTIELAIVGLRDGWAKREDANAALAAIGSRWAAPSPQAQAAVSEQTAAEIRAKALEEAAQACDLIYQDHRDQYKGRGKYAPNNPRRADPHCDGSADGAGECADAIRALATKEAAAAEAPSQVPVVAEAREPALNGIPTTHRHDEGAIARCSYCGRYSLDPATLSDRQPMCECGKQHGWCGSFKKPGPDSKWSGKAPTQQKSARGENGGDDEP